MKMVMVMVVVMVRVMVIVYLVSVLFCAFVYTQSSLRVPAFPLFRPFTGVGE
jgi:hypothetical protein